MHEKAHAFEDEELVIWNGALGIRDFVTIARVESGPEGRKAWLDEPYEMVGPFSLDELEATGRIGFAACYVMSRDRWLHDQAALRQEAFAKHQRAQAELFEELRRSNRRKQRRAGQMPLSDEREHRELLCLPAEGALDASQVKSAYRRIAKSAHPDVGGSHERFVQITQARDILLETIS